MKMNVLNKLIKNKESMTKAIAMLLVIATLIFIIISSTVLIAQNENETNETWMNQTNETNQTEPIINETIEINETNYTEPISNETNETTIFTLVIEDYEGDKVYSQSSICDESNKEWEKIDEKVEVEQGKHNVKIKLTQEIKDIEISSLKVSNETKEYKIRIDNDVPLEKGKEGSIRVYAIDPTAIEFEEAIVTVEAQGSELWKCAEWDFEARECNGEWTYLMNIAPGQDYSFILTPEDPAYAELSPQYIIECTENGAPGTCIFSYLATDDTQYEQFRVGKGAVLNRLNVSVNTTAIPTNALITNATVCILAYRDSILGDDPNDACGIYAGENATGTPTYTVAVAKTQATCTSWSTTVGSPNLVCGEITSWLNSKTDPVASARKLIIVFDGTEQADNNVDLWIDYMYANITYVIPPNTTLVSPSNGNITASKDVNFTCNATDDIQLANITFYWNYTGSWQANETVTVSGTANQTTFVKTNLSNGAILWNCYACDNESACAFALANWTVTVNYTAEDNPPITTLNSPADNYYNDSASSVNVTFNCSATDDINLKNISLYITNSSNQSFSLNQTTNISGTSNSSQWILNLSMGNYTWNCLAYDNASQSDWGDVNRTIKLNYTNTAPQYSNVGSNTTTPNPNEPVLHYAYWTDNQALSGYIFSSNYSGSWANDSFVVMTGTANWSNVTKNVPSSPGVYGWRIYANDSDNAWNVTGIQTITVQNQAPQITLNLPANNTQFNNTQNINFNFTTTDDQNTTLNCSIYLDGALNQTNSSTANNTLTNFLINGISYGSHNWSINCSDGSLSNVSETRYFTINDTIAPSIYYNANTDANGTYSKNWIFVNVTCSDLNKDTVILNWNGTNESFDNNAGDVYWENKTGLADGTYTFYAWCNDSYSNYNQTELRQIILDTQGPIFATDQAINDTLLGQNEYVKLNQTITDTNNVSLARFNVSGSYQDASQNGNEWYLEWQCLANGTYYWYGSWANDSVGNINSTTFSSLSWTCDIDAPDITFVSPTPANNTIINVNYVYVNITSDENLDTAILEWNGTNESMSGTGSNWYKNKTGLADGLYIYKVYGNDSTGNWNVSETRTVTIDTSAPKVTLNSPIEGFSTTSTSITFNWTAVDNYDSSLDCNLTIDGAANVSNIVSLNATATTQIVNGFAIGTHQWNVTCWDDENNTNTSQTRSFTITASSGGGGGGGGGGAAPPAAVCGNNVCETGESRLTCSQDCPKPEASEVKICNITTKLAEINIGNCLRLKEGDRIYFSYNNIEHYIIIENIHQDNTYISIHSLPQYSTLKVNETKEFDLDNDGINDIIINIDELDYKNKEVSVTVQIVRKCECPECSEWQCVDGKQSRTCYNCSAETNYTCQEYREERPCLRYPKFKLINLWWLFLIMVAIFLILLIYKVARKKEPFEQDLENYLKHRRKLVRVAEREVPRIKEIESEEEQVLKAAEHLIEDLEISEKQIEQKEEKIEKEIEKLKEIEKERKSIDMILKQMKEIYI